MLDSWFQAIKNLIKRLASCSSMQGVTPKYVVCIEIFPRFFSVEAQYVGNKRGVCMSHS